MLLWWFLALAHAGDLQDELRLALSARHGVSCDQIWKMGEPSDVRGHLVALSEARQPPTLGMRAAVCITEWADEDDQALAAARGWLQSEDLPGRALAVVQTLDRVSEPVAVELADLAVKRATEDRRFGRASRPALETSVHPEVRKRVKNLRRGR